MAATRTRSDVTVSAAAPAGDTASPTTSAPAAPVARRRRRPAEAEPLGSLARAGARETCPACGTEAITVLSMVLTDGTAVRFASCRRCDHRRWESDEAELSIAAVLERTRR